MKKKILIVTQDFPPGAGGIQTLIHQLAQKLHKSGSEITVICPGRRSDPREYAGVRVLRFSIHSSWLFLPLIFYLPIFLIRFKPTHIIYAQWQVGMCQALVPFLFRDKDVTCLVHGRELLTSVLGPLAPVFRPRILKRASRVVVNSGAVKKLLENSVNGLNTQVIHPGVDPREFYPDDSSALKKKLGLGPGKIIISLTRLVKRKNLHQVVEVFNQLASEDSSLQLVIAGTGPLQQDLADLKKASPADKRIHLPGNLSGKDIRAFYNLGSVFVLPSVQLDNDIEGFGIVFLEAGSCEVPVVGADSGGISDAIADGESGLLIPPRDKPALKKALATLLQDEAKARQMGIQARKRIIAGFTWDHYAEKMLQAMG